MAAGLPEAQSYTFYDAKNQRAGMALFVSQGTLGTDPGDDGLQIGKDLAALSNSSRAGAAAIRGKGPYTNFPIPVTPGTAATYQNVADKAVFVFQDASGQLHRYQVPCPLSTVFLADQETIDYTQSIVKQFVADMLGTTFSGTANVTHNPVQSRNGVVLTGSVGGYRRRGKTPRKFNIFTRNPTETGQGE